MFIARGIAVGYRAVLDGLAVAGDGQRFVS